MKNPYRVDAVHVPYEPHCMMICEWQVLRRRDDGSGWWFLVGSYSSEAEAVAIAGKLNARLEEE